MNQGYVDIHCHILPEIDDGARDEDMTRELLKAEVAEGVSTIIATPHFDMGENLQDLDQIKEKVEVTQRIANEISEDLKIYSGCEILFSQGILDLLREDKIPTLADTNYVLVEFYPSENHRDIYRAFREIIQIGKVPVLAHVERYECFLRHMEYIDELIELGAYVQMNTRSLTGKFYDKRTRFCRNVVKQGLVHFLGTDCHNLDHRPPKWKETVKILDKTVGEHMRRNLTSENAHIMIRGEYL